MPTATWHDPPRRVSSCAGRAGHPRPESKQNDNVGENKAPLALALIQSRAGHTESAFSPDGTFALAWQADRRVDADSGGRSRARDPSSTVRFTN
jgi:hypothetical protein